MSNPYSPPKAPLEKPSSSFRHSPEYRRRKSAKRPLGVLFVIALYVAFSSATAALLAEEGDSWWVGHSVISALIAFWLRNLWWGDDKERKIAVFLGFFAAALSFISAPDSPMKEWPAKEFVFVAEGCYFLASACYLVYARSNSFFAEPPAP